jgi:hypothetical protein
MIFFVWTDKNVEHIGKHNVSPGVDLVALEAAAEAVYVICARPLTAAEKSGVVGRRKRKGKRK